PAKPLLGTVALIAPGAARLDPALPARLLERGAAVGLAGGEARPAHALALPARDIEGALDEIMLAFGGIDTLYRAPADTPWAEAVRPLLDHSLAETRIADVGAA